MDHLAYARSGHGDPVVLVHGIGHRKEAWGRVPELLAADHDVIAVDLPGHGESAAPTKPDACSVPSAADQILRLLDDLGVDRPHVVGNSLGGAIVLELAARGHARTCTALSPAGFYWPWELTVTGFHLLAMKASTAAPEAVLRKSSYDPAMRRRTLRALYEHPEAVSGDQAFGDALNLKRARGFWPFFARCTPYRFTGTPQCPTTVLWGDSDRLLPARQARVAARRMPDALVVTLEGAGHCPQGDEPERVAEACREAFARA